MKTNKAFTLIEVLVVVLIIGILAAIAVPQYRKAVAKSQFATIKFLIKDIVQAQEAYYLAHGEYTNSFENLDITMPAPKEIDGTAYYYDWGYCHMDQVGTECKNSNINISIQSYYSKSNSIPNTKICVIYNTTDLNDYRNSICQEDTGASGKESGNPNVSTKYNVIFWYYQK